MPTVRNVYAKIDWQGYEGDRVILPVCVRSPAMQGRNLTATLKTLSEKIASIDLVLIDTLDRYNFNGDAAACSKRGKIWLETNSQEIENYVKINSLTTWNEVITDPSYIGRYTTINDLYLNNATVRKMIDTNAMYFVSAREKRGDEFDRDAVFKNSVSYMIEEYAGTAVYGETLGYLPEAYWGIYVGNPYFFENHNSGSKSLLLPKTLPVTINRLDPPFAGEEKIDLLEKKAIAA